MEQIQTTPAPQVQMTQEELDRYYTFMIDKIKRVANVIENEMGAKEFTIAIKGKIGHFFHSQGEMNTLLILNAGIGRELLNGIDRQLAEQAKQAAEATPSPVKEG